MVLAAYAWMDRIYVWISESWLFVASVIDLCSRRVGRTGIRRRISRILAGRNEGVCAIL